MTTYGTLASCTFPLRPPLSYTWIRLWEASSPYVHVFSYPNHRWRCMGPTHPTQSPHSCSVLQKWQNTTSTLEKNRFFLPSSTTDHNKSIVYDTCLAWIVLHWRRRDHILCDIFFSLSKKRLPTFLENTHINQFYYTIKTSSRHLAELISSNRSFPVVSYDYQWKRSNNVKQGRHTY